MNDKTRHRLRREIAPLFVLAALALPVTVALLWGRTEGQGPDSVRTHLRDAARLSQRHLGGRLLTLGNEDRSALLQLLWDCLAALEADRLLPETGGLPALCRQPVNLTLVVTLYAAGREPLRATANERALGESTRRAARELFKDSAFQAKGYHRSEQLYARFDLIMEEQDLSPPQRKQFALLDLAEPVGLALWHKGRPYLFLPGDLATERYVDDHLGMLEKLCQDAGLPPDRWRERKYRMSLLKTESFVNSSPGGVTGVKLLRGLPLVRKVGLAQAVRSCRLAADYLVRNQQGDDRFAGLYGGAASGYLGSGGLRAQARAAAALARFCARFQTRSEKHLAACRRALASLWKEIRVPPGEPDTAFVAAETENEVSGPPSLANTAAVLIAFCEYRRVSGDAAGEEDDLIGRLGSFLLLLQAPDGCFRSAKQEEGFPPRADREAEAEAALALVLCYEALCEPRFLLGARKCLDCLSQDETALSDPRAACLYVAAVCRLGALLPPEGYVPAVERALEGITQRQLTREQAPAADLVGGSLDDFPPPIGATAAELEAFAGAWALTELWPRPETDLLGERARRAALSAARYVVQFQFLPENSYYLLNPEATLGGFRKRPGSNASPIESVQSALDGLGVLTQAIMIEMRATDDPESRH